jgi:hypothetical protein
VDLRKEKDKFRELSSRFILLGRKLPNEAILIRHEATAGVRPMHLKISWKSVGKVCASLAAGGICLSPLVAQQFGPRLLPTPVIPFGQNDLPIKTVGLKVDGTFCAAVLTAQGDFVPGAQLTFFREQGNAPPLRLVTGVEGQTVVTGIPPGLYAVQVDSPKGNYQGRLQVQNADPRSIVQAQAPVVPFTVSPQGGAVSEGEFVEDGGYVASDDPRWRRRALLLFGLGAGVATAIAVPIAVHDEHEPPPPVASP